MNPSETMVRLVDALARATAARLGSRRKTATARAALLAAVADLERQLHDLRGDVFKAGMALELAEIEAAQNLEQLTDAMAMPPASRFGELIERLRGRA